jgi:hypothetical protein
MPTSNTASLADTLIRRADGAIKQWRAHWWSLGIPVPHRYGLDEQLAAIRELGRLDHPKARRYLQTINEERRQESTSVIGGTDRDKFTITWHPHARGQLGRILRCHRRSTLTPTSLTSSLERDSRREEVKSVLRKALGDADGASVGTGVR